MKRQTRPTTSVLRCWPAAVVVFRLATSLATAQVEPGWVARFNGAGSYWDEVRDLALGDGCVYVTGFATGADQWTDYATVKYDYSGNQIWARAYGLSGVNSGASAEAVAVDDAGNVFVTGRSAEYINSVPESIYVDAATLKYNSDGKLLWEHRYRLPDAQSQMNNQPQDIAIDSAGNAYVAGAAWVGDGFDLMLLKYSPDGTLLWDRTAGEIGQVWDAGYAVAIDPSGNPVVAGYSHTGYISYGYLIKCSPDGQILWQRKRESYNVASAWWRVVINNAGRIYAYGEIAPPGDGYHIWTSQYDADGTLIWERHYDGNAGGSNFRGGIALTPTGGVVMCGHSADFDNNGGVSNIVTIRYEPDGTEVWRRLNRGGYAQAGGRDVAVDAAGNAYVTGWGFNQNENMDYVTLKYTPEGDLAWTQIFAGPADATDWPIRVAVDDAQNVFVAGDSNGGLQSYFDYATIRYRPQIPGDFDADGDVDLDDYVTWSLCLSGPGSQVPPDGCTDAYFELTDLDGSGDVDLADFAIFQAWFGD